jgi:hypothetical protein
MAPRIIRHYPDKKAGPETQEEKQNRASHPLKTYRPLYPCFPDLQRLQCEALECQIMPSRRKINLEKVRASLDAVCPNAAHRL